MSNSDSASTEESSSIEFEEISQNFSSPEIRQIECETPGISENESIDSNPATLSDEAFVIPDGENDAVGEEDGEYIPGVEEENGPEFHQTNLQRSVEQLFIKCTGYAPPDIISNVLLFIGMGEQDFEGEEDFEREGQFNEQGCCSFLCKNFCYKQ
jgi:hypothetical protein